MRNLFENPVILLALMLLIVVIFGVKKLPDAARSLGRSMPISKFEVKEMKDDGKDHAPGRSPFDGRVVDGQRAEQGAGTFDGQRRGA